MIRVFSERNSKSLDIWLEVGEFLLQITTVFQAQSVPQLGMQVKTAPTAAVSFNSHADFGV